MARLTQAAVFTRQEVESALRVYFQPLSWISQAVHKLKNRTNVPTSADFAISELEHLRTASEHRERKSVVDDWGAWLPEGKAKFFDLRVRQLELAYGILSVSLNEALELRRIGQIARARQAIVFIPPLFLKLADPLYIVLRALVSHARNYGTVPNVAPLDEENFRTTRSRQVARLSSLLTMVLFTKESSFFHKVSSLEELIGKLIVDIGIASKAIMNDSSVHSANEWSVIDSAHFDLNTSLRETIIVLKSFLVAIPDKELEALEAEMNSSRYREIVSEPVAQYGHERWAPLTYEDIVGAKKAS